MEDKEIIFSFTAGLIPFSDSRLIYLGEGSDSDNIREDMNVEFRRINYMKQMIDLGVEINSDEWIRLTGKAI